MIAEDAFKAGYDAYWDGVDPDDNPFKPETPDRGTWDEGWAQAQSEDEDGQEDDTA